MSESVPSVPPPAPEQSDLGRPQYEFNERQNAVFRDLAGHLSVGGWGFIVLIVAYHAVLLGRWAVTGEPMYERFRFYQVWLPLIVVSFSISFIRAGAAFNKIVKTQGRDISHLMDGLKSLDAFFSWMPAVWLVLILAAVVGVVFAVSHALGY